jgi:putative transposase
MSRIIDAHDREIIAWHAVVGSAFRGGMVRNMMLEAARRRVGALRRRRRSNG